MQIFAGVLTKVAGRREFERCCKLEKHWGCQIFKPSCLATLPSVMVLVSDQRPEVGERLIGLCKPCNGICCSL